MTKSKEEQFYDDNIAPDLARLAKLCQEHGMSMVCEVEYEPGEFSRTAAIEPDAHAAIRLVYAASQAHGNLDALVIGLARAVRGKSHSSAVLAAMGIPADVAAQVERQGG